MSGSFNSKFKITITTTLTLVTKIMDMKFPKQVAETADNTAHDTTSGWRTRIKTGVRDLQAFQLTLEWDVDEATHAALLTAFNAATSVNCTIEDASGDEVIAFAANITEIDRVSVISGVYQAVVTVEPTGAPTIT